MIAAGRWDRVRRAAGHQPGAGVRAPGVVPATMSLILASAFVPLPELYPARQDGPIRRARSLPGLCAGAGQEGGLT
ncbi:hypothetical protein ABZW49_42455 [Nonomuraea wenchangensis]